MMPGDDNSGIFVGFPDKGTGTDQTAITDGEEIQIDPTDDPSHTTGSIYGKQAADAAARDAALKPAGQWNAYEISRQGGPDHGVSSTASRSTTGSTRTRRSGSAASACRCTAPATTCSSATCASAQLDESVDAPARRRRQRPGDAVADARRAGLVRDVHAQPRPTYEAATTAERDQHGG